MVVVAMLGLIIFGFGVENHHEVLVLVGTLIVAGTSWKG